MEINNKTLTLERASDLGVLSTFLCGVREIDQLIHKRSGGLSSFVTENDCDAFIISSGDQIVGVFVYQYEKISTDIGEKPTLEIEFIAIREDMRTQGIGRRIINLLEIFAIINKQYCMSVGAFVNRRYSAVGFYEKCGFVRNGKLQGNIVPMIKILE